tara:strand:+ start:892 stop:1326 length:435 start_codon:yes stop_codon:yes gene_type:complete
MIKIMATRFNNSTWDENCRWREKNNFNGCIYNSPVYIKDNIPLQIPLFVIEMNNQTNKIEGIGKIINYVHTDKKYKLYSDQNYNRYTYHGKERINRDMIKDTEKLEKLEERLFKGKSHLKRGQGILNVPTDIYRDYLCYIVSQL